MPRDIEQEQQNEPIDLNPPFSREAVEVLEREAVFKGFFTMLRLTLRHRLFRGGWSGEMQRELFVRDPAVGVLLYDPGRDQVALTEQFRIGALDRAGGPWCLEVVAGMVEEGETLEEVARREVLEEAGLKVGALRYIRSYLPSPGGSSERMHLFCALVDLSEAGGHFGVSDEHEDIRLRVLPCEQVLAALEGGDPDGTPIDNAASIISLQWLRRHREELRAAG
ncbi:ADP-ribose pyrophosphatase [Microbulbifer aggregans]|uniref:ADP-ribose pyrophosphatase n=1 Tax=Microbulbifer aggregans TaxID=1769779 RepID=A0A1C9W422_9GAMM|nr:NUDIX domain-containing protein [Microbulbifer aggregans]AOS95906.1 ADP-ribose pyrophosphatase [Microbulbifer aggregans]